MKSGRQAFRLFALVCAALLAPGCLECEFPTAPTDFFISLPVDASTGESLTPQLTWSDSKGESSYTVQLDTEASFSTPVTFEETGIPANSTQFVVPASVLSPGTTYFWRVRAVNRLGIVTASNAPFRFTTYSSAPGDFTLSAPLDGAAGTSMIPVLSWTDAASEESYTVQIHTDPTFAAPVLHEAAGLPPNTTQYSVPPGVLSPSTLYYWRVKAINTLGPTTASNAPFGFTTGAFPTWFNLSKPFDGMGNMPTAITLEWTNPGGETSFTVQVDTEPSFSAPLTYEATGIAADSYAHNVPAGVLAGTTTYYWRVIAENGAGSTVAANAPFSFTTTQCPASFALVTPLNLATGLSVTPTLTWTASSGHVYYILEVATDVGFAAPLAYTTIVPPGNTASTVPPITLQTATTYYWRVIATSFNGGLTIASNAPFSLTTQ